MTVILIDKAHAGRYIRSAFLDWTLIGFIPDNKELDFSWDCHEFKVKLEIFCVVGPVNTSKFSENLFMAT